MSELLSTVSQELNPETANLSDLPVLKILELLNEHDASVALSIRRVLPQVEEAVCVIAEQMRQGGRLFYVGAGTSGRLGVLDSAECPPTFGTEPELVQAIIAGGHAAMLSAVENIEDCRESAPAELRARQLNAQDVVLGIAASGRTPFVLSGLEYARQVGAKTIALSTRGWGLSLRTGGCCDCTRCWCRSAVRFYAYEEWFCAKDVTWHAQHGGDDSAR
ncbi:N-acetylmuramic acid 6-phosphate etherase [Vibrio metoecus]|uniref:N-acetylmuramic acid 6-phosphate etherase n=1 Tax=Vibrio metoecus TaxID=1481663 RepID=UPI000A86BCBA|nr:N-acetylmuramic acid 6-phosphate etherase [Vibrio metoecus]